MRASRMGERPRPRPRTLTLDWGFGVGLVVVAALAWWVHGDEPPGLPGEPDLRPYRGAPLLVVYGAPGCAECPTHWRALRAILPAELQVLHLSARDGDAGRRVPAFILRDARGRWRLEHRGPFDSEAEATLRRALLAEGVVPASPRDGAHAPP